MQELEKILEEIEQAKREPWYRLNNYDVKHKLDGAINRIVDIIRKHMNDGWIPVDKRLPEEGEEVLVWYEYFRYKDYNCMFQTYGIGYQYNRHWSGDVNGVKARCIAWQPLPEPYHQERSNNHDGK